MKTKRTTLLTRFEPETRFDVPPVPAAPFRGTRETELEQVKNQVLRAALNEAPDADYYAPLRRAATEAAGVAWLTPFPLLFLPALFEEKATQARRHGRDGPDRAGDRPFVRGQERQRRGRDARADELLPELNPGRRRLALQGIAARRLTGLEGEVATPECP